MLLRGGEAMILSSFLAQFVSGGKLKIFNQFLSILDLLLILDLRFLITFRRRPYDYSIVI